MQAHVSAFACRWGAVARVRSVTQYDQYQLRFLSCSADGRFLPGDCPEGSCPRGLLYPLPTGLRPFHLIQHFNCIAVARTMQPEEPGPVDGTDEYTVHFLLAWRKQDTKIQVLVKWWGWSFKDSGWEDE